MSNLRKLAWLVGAEFMNNGRGEDSAVTRTPKVALLIETSRGYGRALLRGIVRYARLNGPWGFYVTPGDFEQVLPRMRSWGGTGIIARIETAKVARAILDSGLPTIALDLSAQQLRPDHPLSRLSEVASDSYGAARLAAEHLLERGLRHYAYVGVHGRVWSEPPSGRVLREDSRGGFRDSCLRPAPRRARSRLGTRAARPGALAQRAAAADRPAGLRR